MALPFWLSGTEVSRLSTAAITWFDEMKQWASWPLANMDPTTCAESMLKFIAWQRDIDRFDGEPLALFRKRVKYARINAVDSGSVAGFKRIFMRLDIGYVEIEERMPGRDWDVVSIRLSDSQLAKNQKLLGVLIQHYGRTCRRYEWTIITPLPIGIRAVEFGNDYAVELAAVPPCSLAIHTVDFSNDTITLTAKGA